MQIHVTTDIPGLEESIRHGLSTFEGEIDEIHVIHLEIGANRSKFAGLDSVLELASKTKALIVMVSVAAAHFLADDARFQAAMGYTNVIHYQMPQIKGLIEAVKEWQTAKRPADPVAIRLANFSWKDNPVSTLKHDLKYVLQGYSSHPKEAWIKLARQVFGNLLFENLVTKTQEAKGPEQVRYFAGQFAAGVFIDIEGTLVKDGELNQEMVRIIKEESKTRPITIWTGGNPDQYRRQIRQAGIFAKILPKQIFASATVEEAYDDLSEDKLAEEYEIVVDKFRQIYLK